jgi:hypothetical protein
MRKTAKAFKKESMNERLWFFSKDHGLKTDR